VSDNRWRLIDVFKYQEDFWDCRKKSKTKQNQKTNFGFTKNGGITKSRL